MKFTFLGTGSGVPAKHRNVASLALHLMNKESAIWLFDCGEATQHHILHTSIKLRKMEKIFITHLHGDHIFGLPGLLGSRSFQGGESPLTIIGPKGIREFVETSIRISTSHINYPLHIEEIEEDGIVYEDDFFIVKTRELIHGIPSYGFRIQQKDLPGPLLISKVKDAGIPPGPVYERLKKGEEVILPDGRIFQGKDFIGLPKKGKIIAIIGDTRLSENAIHLAKGANTLVHEATFSSVDEEIAYTYFHSTTKDAAKVANLAGVNELILNHISSRYQQEDLGQLLLEAKSIFSNTFIAEDFSTFTV
ncbi:ribonuclease Z [Evansella sp. AB-P1]|uniref:ribonuclease Z n=1 Tax=Evansella sp. AB-P1 TaxID=3037653 RepID=UPI00241E41B0|nr:ribonuclease Z [Evansella sp. AB-P1]MDG5789451.1 ribonuclease Z [Evansella sp. AB-P1]